MDKNEQNLMERWMPLWLPILSVGASSAVTVAVLTTRIGYLEQRVEKLEGVTTKIIDTLSDIKGDVREIKTMARDFYSNSKR